MNNESDKNTEQQKHQQGSNTSKVDPSQGKPNQSDQQDGSKKNPSQDNPQHKDQSQKQAV
jgi:hypothetical protein